MADLITGNTQLSPTKAEIIAALVQKELAFQAKLVPTVTDVSMFAVKGASSISFPKFSSFTVVNRTSGAQGDASVLTGLKDTMSLNFNAYIAWIIDSSDEIQSSVEVQSLFAQRAAAAHARYVDTQIIAALIAGAGFNQGVLTTITKDVILDLREYVMGTGQADLSDLYLIIPPDQEKAMLKIAEFTENQVYGAATIMSGQIGKVYGVPVIVHNGMTAGTAVMYSKNALAVGFQKSPAISEQGANEYGTGAVRVAMDQLFGTLVLEQAVNGAASGKSPLIAMM